MNLKLATRERAMDAAIRAALEAWPGLNHDSQAWRGYGGEVLILPLTRSHAMSETDKEFVERIKREWDGDNVPCVEDFDQLIAIARRGADAADEIERLKVKNIQMQAALGYAICADDERHIIPENPFRCGVCDANKGIHAEIERLKAALRFYAAWPTSLAANVIPYLLDAGKTARAALGGEGE